MPSLLDWIACDYPLCNVAIDNDKKIEDAGSRTLQVRKWVQLGYIGFSYRTYSMKYLLGSKCC